MTLASPPSTPLEVRYTTRADTAEEGVDYLPANGELTFGGGPLGLGPVGGVDAPGGQTTADVEVSIVGDEAIEGNERFFLELTDPDRPHVLQAQALGTISNDDEPAPFAPPPPGNEPASNPVDDDPVLEDRASVLETEVPPAVGTQLGPAAPAATGPQPPPPAPPGSAIAPLSGPAPGAAPGAGPAVGQSTAMVTSPVGVPAVAPAPVPQVVPGIAGKKEAEVEAAPESEYAMVRYEQGPAPDLGFALAGGIALLSLTCVLAWRTGKEQRAGRPCPSLN